MDSTPCIAVGPSPPATNAERVLETINEMDIRPNSPSVLAPGAAAVEPVSRQMEMSPAGRNEESLLDDATQIDEGGFHANGPGDVVPAMQGQEAEGRGRGASPRRGAGRLAGQQPEETSPERRAILERRRLRRVGVLADYASAMVEQGEEEAVQRVEDRREFRALMEEGNRNVGNLVALLERRVAIAKQSENRAFSVIERILNLMERNMPTVERGPAGVVEAAPAPTAPPALFPTSASRAVHRPRDEVLDLFHDFNIMMPECSAARTQGNDHVPKVFGEPAPLQDSDEETDLDCCVPATQGSPRTANIPGTNTSCVLQPSNQGPAPKRWQWREQGMVLLGSPSCQALNMMFSSIRNRGYAALLMGSLYLPNVHAYRAISRALDRAGYVRTEEQVRTKWKALKKEFYSVVQVWGGVPKESSWPAEYASLRQLWCAAGRPRLVDRQPRSSAQPDDPAESSEEEGAGLQESAGAATHRAVAGKRAAAAAAGQSSDSNPGEGTSSQSTKRVRTGPKPSLQDCMTLLTRMDRRLKRLEEEVSQLGARVRAVEDRCPPASQTPVVPERMSSGSSEDRLQIVTSEEEASDTPRNPPTSDPSAVVVVSSAVPGSSSSSP
uniref:Uncharacterized protein n=1 Tax=Sphaerodactylus townsendi TaxID=933632 RepID=A0ACB8E9A2_9SAUR